MNVSEVEERDWTEQPYPSGGALIFNDSGTLKKVEFTKELWNKAQTVLDQNSEAQDLINYLKLSDKTETSEVNI